MSICLCRHHYKERPLREVSSGEFSIICQSIVGTSDKGNQDECFNNIKMD